MMNYQGRIREIQSAFVMGYQDRETCIRMFEELLHDYKLLPAGEQLDRTITNENFLNLLKAAKDHTVNKQIPSSPQQPSSPVEALEKINKALNGQDYRIANSIKQRCPVCQQPAQALFNRVQSLDQQHIPVDPPRCQPCMMTWVEEKFGVTPHIHGKLAEPHSTVSRDGSPTSPMSPSEADFFAEYERQMQEQDNG
jgi:hypothetical protein